MLDHWFSAIRLPIGLRRFHQLPQNPAYKYEYLGTYALLSPRPKFHHARLRLRRRPDRRPPETGPEGPIVFRPLADGDWPKLSRLFAWSFHRVQPFASLTERRRLEAARACLKHTREGRDGPLLRPACQVALAEKDARPIGAALVTLVPPVDLDDIWGLQWKAPPGPEQIAQRQGHAHLTWIFVNPWFGGQGAGSELLARAEEALLDLGYEQLITSFIQGNDLSMLWHWRNGFELCPHLGSRRAFRARMREIETTGDAGTADNAETANEETVSGAPGGCSDGAGGLE